MPAKTKSLFGYTRDALTVIGDIVAPTGEQWSADEGGRDPPPSASRKKMRVRRAGQKRSARDSSK